MISYGIIWYDAKMISYHIHMILYYNIFIFISFSYAMLTSQHSAICLNLLHRNLSYFILSSTILFCSIIVLLYYFFSSGAWTALSLWEHVSFSGDTDVLTKYLLPSFRGSHLFIYLFIYLSISLHIYLSIYLSIPLFIYLFIYLSIYLFIYENVYFIHLFIFLIFLFCFLQSWIWLLL